MPTLTPDQTLFESTFCTRCGGSGRYSFNLMHGDRCYGCGGQGVTLTARGKAAKAFYIESQQLRAADLQPGMFVWDDTMGKVAKFLPVLSVKQSSSCAIVNGERVPFVLIATSRGSLGVYPDTMVRAVRDEEQRKAQVAAAKAYQATLTKAGKPAKRPAAQMVAA